jgi:cell division protein FtsA
MMFAQSEIRKSDHRGLFTFGIVITGGTAMMKNIEDLASDIFKYDIKVGIPMLSGGISDSIQDPTFSTAAGLIEFAVLNGDKYEEEDGIPGLLKSFSKRIKNLFENLY